MTTTFDRSTLATSRYDALSDKPIFTWSTPADPTATPWRVAWPSRLHSLIVGARLDAGSTVDDRYADLFVDYGADCRGCRELKVRLRDNRDPEAHAKRMLALADWLRWQCTPAMVHHWPSLHQPTGTVVDYLLVSDDLTADPKG